MKQKLLCFAQPLQKAPPPAKFLFRSRKDYSQLEIIFIEVSQGRERYSQASIESLQNSWDCFIQCPFTVHCYFFSKKKHWTTFEGNIWYNICKKDLNELLLWWREWRHLLFQQYLCQLWERPPQCLVSLLKCANSTLHPFKWAMFSPAAFLCPLHCTALHSGVSLLGWLNL